MNVETVLDALTAGLLRLGREYGMYLVLPACYAIVFPLAAILASVGHWWPWFFFHTTLFLAVIAIPTLFPDNIKTLIRAICYPMGIIIALGIFDATKPFAVLAGMILGQVGLGLVVIIGSLARLGYGIAIAPLSKDEGIDIQSAQKQAVRFLHLFVSVAAWELFIAWYVTSLGTYLSVRAAIFAIFAVGVIIYGGIAWNIGGDFGRKCVYYAAAIGFTLVTVHAAYQFLVVQKYISDQTQKYVESMLPINILKSADESGSAPKPDNTDQLNSADKPANTDKPKSANESKGARIWFWVIVVLTEFMILKSGLTPKVTIVRNEKGVAISKRTQKGKIPYASILSLGLILLFFDWIWWGGGTITTIHTYLKNAWG